MNEITKRELIAEGAALKERITAGGKRLKEIEAKLLKGLPPGQYQGEDGEPCRIIDPEASIKLEAAHVEEVKGIVGHDIFAKLFDRNVTHKAAKGFRELLPALVPGKREQKKVLEIVEAPGTAYVKWS